MARIAITADVVAVQTGGAATDRLAAERLCPSPVSDLESIGALTWSPAQVIRP